MKYIPLIIFLSTFSLKVSAENQPIWNAEKNAVAFCTSSCFVVSGKYITDVTSVENLNIGKLGLTSKDKYEKIVTFPHKWLNYSENEYMVSFTTQAWLNGERYTVTEPVLIKNGVYFQR